MGTSRRTFLKGGLAATVFAPALVRGAAAAGDPIVIASMYDLSGGLEASGKPMYDVLNFAVGEMNEAGGLLGREIKVVSFDTQTNMQLYAQYAQEAALRHKVAVVHGGITSASREVIRPVLDKYRTLYFYDMPYEGGVCDRNIFIDGVTPAHNTQILVEYGMKTWGKNVYTLAADYNYGQITSDWVKKYVKDGGGEVLGTEFFPLDATSFGATISKIQSAKPDWIMTILVGGGPISFYRQFNAAGLQARFRLHRRRSRAPTSSSCSQRKRAMASSSPITTWRRSTARPTKPFSNAFALSSVRNIPPSPISRWRAIRACCSGLPASRRPEHSTGRR
jgi:urea transport system substrate-binding protein